MYDDSCKSIGDCRILIFCYGCLKNTHLDDRYARYLIIDERSSSRSRVSGSKEQPIIVGICYICEEARIPPSIDISFYQNVFIFDCKVISICSNFNEAKEYLEKYKRIIFLE